MVMITPELVMDSKDWLGWDMNRSEVVESVNLGSKLVGSGLNHFVRVESG